MSTALYFVGFLVLIGGLAWGATALGVPTLWVMVGAVVLAGIAIISIAGSVKDREVAGSAAPRTTVNQQGPVQPGQPAQPAQPAPQRPTTTEPPPDTR